MKNGVAGEAPTRAPGPISAGGSLILASLTRPYRVTIPMVILVSLVPLYIAIAEVARGREVHAPAVALDTRIPLLPGWALVYGALYAFLIALPVLIVRQEELIRRTVYAYLTIWIAAYVSFMIYPTAAPRPDVVTGEGFAVWSLLALYGADPPYNCFPSLHVAHSFVSALAAARVHRPLGIAATAAASLVAVSTLFTKQHWVLDVIAGIALAGVAWWIFLRGARIEIPDADHRAAPLLALLIVAVVALGVAGFGLIYRLQAG